MNVFRPGMKTLVCNRCISVENVIYVNVLCWWTLEADFHLWGILFSFMYEGLKASICLVFLHLLGYLVSRYHFHLLSPQLDFQFSV